MTFFALHIAANKTNRLEPLRAACEKLGVDFVALDPSDFDFSAPSPVKKGDIVYRTNRGKQLRFFEDYLVRKGVVTFYQNEIFHKPDPFMLEKNGIATPKSIFCFSRRRKMLTDYVAKLGGFPIVVKALGGTRGMGVMKVESFPVLFSIVDFLMAQGKLLVLKKFIAVKNSARLIVLGNKVIASIEYEAPQRDFRTNALQKPVVKPKKYSAAIEALAVKATQAMGWEFSGVDILIDSGASKKAYVAEVNFPCNFMRAQKTLDQDIALQMVKFLVAKSKRLSS